MSIYAQDNDKDFELPPVGNVQGVCVFIVDCGTHVNKFSNKEYNKVIICWELDASPKDSELPFIMSRSYNCVLGAKSNLRRDLESWRGKNFTSEELKYKFDIEVLKKINCLINVVSKPKDNGKKEGRGIGSISPCMKGMPQIHPKRTKIPDWIENEIKQSVEYKQKNETVDQANGTTPDIIDDDLPF